MQKRNFQNDRPTGTPNALMDIVCRLPSNMGDPNFSRPKIFKGRDGSDDGNSRIHPNFMQNSSGRPQQKFRRRDADDDRNPVHFNRGFVHNNPTMPPSNRFPGHFPPNANIPNANPAQRFDCRPGEGNPRHIPPNFMPNCPPRPAPPFFPNVNDPGARQPFTRISPTDGNSAQRPPNFMPNIAPRYPTTSIPPPPYFKNVNNPKVRLPFPAMPPFPGGNSGPGLLPTPPQMPPLPSFPPMPSAALLASLYPIQGKDDSESAQSPKAAPCEAKAPPPCKATAPPSCEAKAPPPLPGLSANLLPIAADDIAMIPEPSSTMPSKKDADEDKSAEANLKAENSKTEGSIPYPPVIKDLPMLELPPAPKMFPLVTKPPSVVLDLLTTGPKCAQNGPKLVATETIGPMTTDSNSPDTKHSSSTRQAVVAPDPPPTQFANLSKIKMPTFGKDGARKRLRAFTSHCKALDKAKAEEAGETATAVSKEETAVAKKKRIQKKSVIEQIMEEETRLKMVLQMNNCNTDSAFMQLQSMIDDPMAIKAFEKKGRELKERTEKDALKKPKERSRSDSNGSRLPRTSRDHRSTKRPTEDHSSRAKKRIKIVPKSWAQLKSLGISLGHTVDESDSAVSPLKPDSRRGEVALARFSPLDDKIWTGLAMHSPMVSLRVNRPVGHSKKEYPGSMVRTTMTKPHITFCRNAGTVPRHYMSRSEAKYRNKHSRDIWRLMKSVWTDKSVPTDKSVIEDHPGYTEWYVQDWQSIDHERSVAMDHLAMTDDSGTATGLGKKDDNVSEASCNDDSMAAASVDVMESDAEIFEVAESEPPIADALMDESDCGISDVPLKTDSELEEEPLTPADDKPLNSDSHAAEAVLSAQLEEEVENFELICSDSNEKSVSPISAAAQPEPLSSPESAPIPADETPECGRSPVPDLPSPAAEIDTVHGQKVSELTLKEVKALLCSEALRKREKKVLKELKNSLHKIKKEKKKLKKERKRMRKEKKKQKKIDKKLSSKSKLALENEPVVATPLKSDHTEELSLVRSPEKIPADEDIYNPEELQLSDDNANPRQVSLVVNERYSPTSSPFYFSDGSEPSPNESFSYDECPAADVVEHRNPAAGRPNGNPVERTPSPIGNTIETAAARSTPCGVPKPSMDLSAIPTPPSAAAVPDDGGATALTEVIPLPVPAPKPAGPLPVPPVDLQLMQSIVSSVRKEVIQQSVAEPSLAAKAADAHAKPVAFRLSLAKTPAGKLAKPSVPSLFREDPDDRAREARAIPKLTFRPEGMDKLKQIPLIPAEASVSKTLNETTKAEEITANVSHLEPYSPSQCDSDSHPARKVVSGGMDVVEPSQLRPENKENTPVVGNPADPKRSRSPSRENRTRPASSPPRRHRDRSPPRRSRDGYSRSRRSPPRHRRSRSRSPKRSVRHRDDRASGSKTAPERRAGSPAPKRAHYQQSRGSPIVTAGSLAQKIETVPSQPVASMEGNKIECVSNMGEPRSAYDINLSDIGLPEQDFGYADDSNYNSEVMDSCSSDKLGSPKRPSLTERLRQEHGLHLEDSPSAFDHNDKYFDLEHPQSSYDDNKLDSAGGQARVIQVGNVLQILPQEMPAPVPTQTHAPIEEPVAAQSVELPKNRESAKQRQNYSVPLSPSFSPPPEGGVSPLPPPSPKPMEVLPQVTAPVTPVTPFVGGPIPGLSSEALISAAAAASAASNVPFAQLISVLQEQNLLPKSVPLQQETVPTAPAKVSSSEPEPQLSDVNKRKMDIESLKKANRERKLRKRQEKEKRRNDRKRQKEEEINKQMALQRAEEDNDEALIMEAISEVPELDGPIPDSYLNDDEEIGVINATQSSLALPPPDKGILVIPSYKETVYQQRKAVCFADGIIPGEGTSASGEETVVETPVRTVKRKLKKDRPTKKTRTREIKSYDPFGDGVCSPPPPPLEPPPPNAINLYPGWTHCTYTGPETVIIYTQKLLDPAAEQMQENSLIIPPGMLVHSDGLMNAAS